MMTAIAPDDASQPMRRPLKSRELKVFQHLASWLVRRGVAPNVISVLSIVFAFGAMAALVLTNETSGWPQRGLWAAATGMILLRLLANMLDGMVAIESGKQSPVGDLYNEVPDRISDVAILIGAGYASGGVPELGWVAAIVAVFVAYVRAIGASAGAGQAFHGPMAKPYRMFALVILAAYCALTPMSLQPIHHETGFGVIGVGLAVIVLGGVLTAWRRLLFIARRLRSEQS